MNREVEIFYTDGSVLKRNQQDRRMTECEIIKPEWACSVISPPALFHHVGWRAAPPEPVNHRLGSGSRFWKPLARFQDNKFATIDICHDAREQSQLVFVKLSYKDFENCLSQEKRILHTLNRYAKMHGIPRLVYFQEISPILNQFSRSDILVTSLSGICARSASSRFSPMPVAEISHTGIRLISTLRRMHRFNVAHGDIRPENIFLSRKRSVIENVSLVNFGSAANFRDIDGNHKYSRGVPRDLRYDMEFCSRFTHQNLSPSRVSDLESLGYAIVFLRKGRLPWSLQAQVPTCGHSVANESLDRKAQSESALQRRDNAVARMKLMALKNPEGLCAQLPESLKLAMTLYFSYVSTVSFAERPNYDYVSQLFEVATWK